MNLLENFKQNIKQQNLFNKNDNLLIATSGGVDSVVLCELCKQANYNFAIAHCNFQLRNEDSRNDEKFVQQLAKNYNVPFYTKTFDTKIIAENEKKSIEETARNLRYAWFYQLIVQNKYAYILTAHHANDNIETVLMNFCRGTGIKGLHGILPKQNKIIRPLLFANKNTLIQFAMDNKLNFVKDYTNDENDFTRNYFRNKIVPCIKKIMPSAEENILKNITRLAEAEQLYNQAIDGHKKKLLEIKGTETHIPVLKLQKLKPLSTIIYEIIKDFNFTSHQTEDVLALVCSESGKYISSATHRIIKNRNWLIISPNKTAEAQNILIEEVDEKINFERGLLHIEKQQQPCYIIPQPTTAQIDAAEIKFPLLLRKWKQGDYFYPLGMQKKKKLSRFFIDQKLSLTEKENMWVIETQKKIIWVVGKRIDDRFKITHKTKNILQINFAQT